MNEALKTFSQMAPEDDKADLGKGVKLIGRWHHLVGFSGVAIAGSNDLKAISNWLLDWNTVLDADVTIVLDDDEPNAIPAA